MREKRFVFLLVQYFCRKAPCDQENSISSTTGYKTSRAAPLNSSLPLPSIDPGPYVIIANPSCYNSIISRESDIPMPPPCSCSLYGPSLYSKLVVGQVLLQTCHQNNPLLLTDYQLFSLSLINNKQGIKQRSKSLIHYTNHHHA